MWYKRRYLIFVAMVLTVSLTVPTAVDAIPDSAAEYMARLASDRLYSFYLDSTDKPAVESEESFTVSEVISVDEESNSELPENAVAVQAFNFSRYEADEVPKILFANETAFTVNANALTSPSTKKAAVLILHSHGTESYLPAGAGYYIEGDEFRSTDTTQNVVAVGEAFARTLRSLGIVVYHDTTMYDEKSYESAYAASRAAAKRWLAKKDDIGYIIDIHRDSIEDNDGRALKTRCYIQGQECAQVMLVVGTDEAGATHPNWEQNLALAVRYQKQLNTHPTFARPIYLRSASYNQQLSTGGLLLEVGSAANTLDEAKRAAVAAAEQFAAILK